MGDKIKQRQTINRYFSLLVFAFLLSMIIPGLLTAKWRLLRSRGTVIERNMLMKMTELKFVGRSIMDWNPPIRK